MKPNKSLFGNFTIVLKSFPILFLILLFSLSTNAQNCTVNAGLPQTICPGATLTLTGVVTGNLSSNPNPVWSVVSGPGGTIINPAGPNTTVTGYGSNATSNTTIVYRYSATCADGFRTYQDVTITVKRKPTTSTVGSNVTHCSTGTYGPLAGATLGANETGHWSSSPSSGVSFSNSSSPTSNYTISQPGIYTFTWTITTSGTGQGCTSAASMTVNESGPAAISAGTDRSISCAGNSLTLAGSNPGLSPQVGNWTVISGPNTPTFSNANSATSTLSNLTTGIYTLRWNVSGPCTSGADTVVINVLNTNTAQTASAGTSLTYCVGSGVTQAILSGTTPTPGNTATWTASGSPASGTTIVSANNATTIISGLNSSSASTYTYNYAITSSGGCSSSSSATIKFIPAISLSTPSSTNVVLACGASSASLTTTRISPSTLTNTGITTSMTVISPSGSSIQLDNVSSSGLTDTWHISNITGTNTFILRLNYISPCGNTYVDYTVKTSSSPSVGANAGTDQILACTLTSTNLAGNAVSSPNTGTWYLISGPNVPSIANIHLNNSAISGLVYGEYSFRWVISNGVNCATNTDTVNIDVPPPVNAINAGSDATICYNTPYQFQSTGALIGQTINWTVSPATGVTFYPDNTVENPTVNGLSASTVYTFIKTISIPCGSISDTVIITTNSSQGPAQASAGADQCLSASTTTISLTGNVASPYTGTWSAINAIPGTIVSPNSSTTTVTGMTPGSYRFVWAINGGACFTTTYDTVLVTISAATTTANAGSDQILCNVTSATLSGNSPTIGTGIWTQTGGASGVTITTPNSNSTTVTGLTSGTYFFNWTISNGACSSSTNQMMIVVSDPPTTTANAGPDQTVCTTTATLAGNAVGTGETGFWDIISIPSSAANPTISSSSSPTSTITGLTTGTYTLRWSIIKPGSCPASTDNVNITVTAPASINASLASSYCAVTSLTVTGTAGSNGTWSVTSQPSGSPTVVFSAIIPGYNYLSTASPLVSGVYTFRYDIAASGSCSASIASKTVTIYALPNAANAGADINVCLGNTSTSLNATAASAGSGVWSLVSGPNIPTFGNTASPTSTLSNLISGNYILSWTVSNGTCTSSSDNVQINVESDANAGFNQTLCEATTTIVSANTPVLGSGTWSYVSGPAGSVIASPNSPTTNIDNLVAGTYVFQWSTPLAGCSANTSNITIVNGQTPTTANAGSDQPTVGISTMLAANTPIIGNGLWSLTAGPNTPTITNAASPTTSITGLIPGNYIFAWTISNGACSSYDEVTITSVLSLSGTVYNDTNGTRNNLIDGNPTNNPSSQQLYANLVSSSTGNVVGVTAVSSDGTYLLTASNGLIASTNYNIVISTTSGTVGSTISSTLPTGWVNTSEGTTGSGDGTPNGMYAVSVSNSSVGNINFGIEQLPTGNNATDASRLNPGGTNTFNVASTLFTGADADGNLDSIRIVSFPTFTTTIIINGVSYTTANWPSAGVGVKVGSNGNIIPAISIDPTDGAVTPVITFKYKDNAGQFSAANNTVTLPDDDLTISGTVFDDGSGTSNGAIDGTGKGLPSNVQLYANLVNSSTNLVIGKVAVSANGNYVLGTSNGIQKSGSYNVVLSTTNGTIGSSVSSILPSGWVSTAEGSNGSGDGVVNGITATTMGSTPVSITDLNFGIDSVPVAYNKSYGSLDSLTFNNASNNATYPYKVSLNDASGTSNGSVTSVSNAIKPGKLSGSDLEDGNYSGTAGTNMRRTLLLPNAGLPDAGFEVLVYYSSGTPLLLFPNPSATDASFTYWNSNASRYEIPNFNDTSLSIFIKKVDGNNTLSFTYGWKDSAGVAGPIATYNINSISPLPVTLINFNAKLNNNNVELSWQTASEINTDHFVIERSEDGRVFKEVLSQSAAGHSSSILKYSDFDKNINELSSNVFYYRIKTVDYDNTYSYSNIKSVNLNNKTQQIKAWPVPFTSEINLEICSKAKSQATIKVYDSKGNEVYSEELELQKGTNLIQRTQLANLAAGVYNVSIMQEGILSHIQLMKVLN